MVSPSPAPAPLCLASHDQLTHKCVETSTQDTPIEVSSNHFETSAQALGLLEQRSYSPHLAERLKKHQPGSYTISNRITVSFKALNVIFSFFEGKNHQYIKIYGIAHLLRSGLDLAATDTNARWHGGGFAEQLFLATATAQCHCSNA